MLLLMTLTAGLAATGAFAQPAPPPGGGAPPPGSGAPPPGSGAPPPGSGAPPRHEVVHADTLWDLAKHYYGDPFQWSRIYEANKAEIKDPHWIYPNQVFVIPGLNTEAQVVKTGQPEPSPPPAEEEAAPEPAPAPPAEPAPAADAEAAPPGGGASPPAFSPASAPGALPLPESLSSRMPKGMTEGQPSAYRLLMPTGWRPDGTVRPFKDRDAIAATGDSVVIRVSEGVAVSRRMRFTVYRPAAPTEADADQGATYMQKVGVVEAVKRVGERDYRAVVAGADGAVQSGDLVKAGD